MSLSSETGPTLPPESDPLTDDDVPNALLGAMGPATSGNEVDSKPAAANARESPANERKQPATMHLNDNKAGMQGLDTERINKIIEDASRGSKFYQHKQQRQKKIDERIQRMLERRAALTSSQLAAAEAEMAELSTQVELRRDLSRFVVHVDMDAFYAAVEMRDRPELRDVPMAVGSMGMLSTSNYAARRFGIRSAMPGFIGKKLCPRLVIVPCNFDKYRAASKQVQQVLARYDPNFSMASLDEAYLDVTERVSCHLSDACGTSVEQNADEVAQMLVTRMRGEIQEATNLTASAGIACNGMLAKICSDQNKPNGQYFLPRDRSSVLGFLRTLPCRKVSGIGNVTAQMLSALDISTCGDLLQQRCLLRLLFSDSSCHSLLGAGLGVRGDDDDEGDDEPRHQKSVSTETTFSDTASREELMSLLAELCSQLADDVQRKQLQGRTVTVKVKTATFEIRQRSRTQPEPTSLAETILAVARGLFLREIVSGEPLRLLGVRLSSLSELSEDTTTEPRQMTLDQLVGKGAAGVEQRLADSKQPLASKWSKAPSGPRQATLAEMSGPGRRGRRDGSAADSVKPVGSSPGCIPGTGSLIDSDVFHRDSTHVCNLDNDLNGIQTCGRLIANLSDTDLPAGLCQGTRDLAAENVSTCCSSAPGRAASSTEQIIPINEEHRSPGACAEPSEEHSLCPVCAQPLPTALAMVNRHLDECLNQKLLSEITDGEHARGTKRPAPRPVTGPLVKHKRIESFFVKK